MSDRTHACDDAATAPGTPAARRGHGMAAPFVCGFLVALALYVGLRPPSVQATPGQMNWNDPATFVPRVGPDLAPRLEPGMFRDDRRLMEATWRGRGGDTPSKLAILRAVPATAFMTSPPRRLRTE